MNARPEADFKYRSNCTARVRLGDAILVFRRHGRHFVVWRTRPELNVRNLVMADCRVVSRRVEMNNVKSVRLRQGYVATIFALLYDASEDWR